MPSRIVRDGINSSRAVSSLPEDAQLFYRALMLIVDDYGRLEVDLDVIRASCFARQLNRWPTARIEGCIASAADTITDDGSPLISRYRVGSKEYLQINHFGQRIQSKPKYPHPSGGFETRGADGVWRLNHSDSTVLNGDSRLANGGPPFPRAHTRTYSESESYSNAESKSNENHSPAAAGEVENALVPSGWFEEFWALYWRKDGRLRAEQAFKNRVKTEQDWERVRKAVIAQSGEMLAREKHHRPHASSWLSQGRMFDEDSPARIRSPAATDDKYQQRRDNVNKLTKHLLKQKL